MSNKFDEPVGLLKEATIFSYDNNKKTIKIQLDNSTVSRGNSNAIDIPMPSAFMNSDGSFIGSEPIKGSKIVVGQGSGNQYYYVSSLNKDSNKIPSLTKNIKIQYSDFSKIELNNSEIKIGSDKNNITINASQFYSNSIDNQYSFSQASYSINGIVKREKKYQTNYSDELKFKDSKYYLSKQTIGLDPLYASNNLSETFTKNPPLVELRKVVYEYQESSNILDDFSESLYYKNQKSSNNYSYPDRRKLRSNILNLSLNNPNYLMESISGTVVDLFGNILDLNRYPINFSESTLSNDLDNDKTKTFYKLKELQRKAIACHFEINSKKSSAPDVNDFSNYSRNRSRFYIDIDKEGQFKINIPASSEVGNIPILSRYENFSHVSNEDNSNPNKLIFREDFIDIVHDSFGIGSISIQQSPNDRKTNSPIKYGTAYHNLLDTCKAHQILDFINYQNDETIKLDSSYVYSSFIKSEIFTSGVNANAGGRSGQINLDGSIDLNIGANTSDRQSIILDTAGGIIGNIGRDRNNHSAVLNLDGDMIVQIGGYGISSDSRFDKLQNSYLPGVLDIRVLRPGYQATMLRIDKEGVKVLTAGRMMFHSNGDIILKSDSNMTIEAENLTMNGRMVLKESGGSI